MNFKIGYSIFPSTWNENKSNLDALYSNGSAIFTSLHISEEFDENFAKTVTEMLSFCKNIGYKIIADLSPRTLPIFKCNSISELQEKLCFDIARVDFGFSLEEVIEASNTVPICLNASTLSNEWLIAIKKTNNKFYAMHNYYPRPETGLDNTQFDVINKRLQQYEIEVMAFIPGDLKLRGPIFEGLPTLESHRHLLPYVAFVEMILKYNISWVFVGDGLLSKSQSKLIEHVIEDETFCIPVVLEKNIPAVLYSLLQKRYTIRPDSPSSLIRFQESREYATQGMIIPPANCVSRKKGTLTLDNERYARYSGEIQLTRSDFPSDERVNVLGYVLDEYISLLEVLPNNSKFKLTSEII